MSFEAAGEVKSAQGNFEQQARIPEYVKVTNQTIDRYCARQSEEVIPALPEEAAQARKALVELLSREDSGRLRGALVMAAYEIAGGKNLEIAAQGALAVELIQAGAVAHDDIQDKNPVRRGGSSLHAALAESFINDGLDKDKAEQRGESIAINLGTQAFLEAQNVIDDIEEAPSDSLRLTERLIRDSMIATADGQNIDISLQATDKPDLDEIVQAAQAKTAFYTVLLPLQVGITLAKGEPGQDPGLEEFAVNLGAAFQAINDLKVMDRENPDQEDILNNKATMLMHYTLASKDISGDEREELYAALKRGTLTESQFEHCQDIIQSSGAVEKLEQEIAKNIETAKVALPDHLQALAQIPDLMQTELKKH